MLERAGVDADVARLTRLERAHVDDQHRLRRTHEAAAARAALSSQVASQLEAVIGRVTDTRGDRFAMTVDGHHHAKRVDAGAHLQRLLLDHLDRTPPESIGHAVEVGTLAGLTITGQAITTIEDEIRLAVPDAHIEIRYTALDWKRSEPSSVITRLERHIQRLPETLAATRAEAEQARGEAERAEARIGVPWDRADELARLRRRQQEIDEQLAAAASKSPDSSTPSTSPPSSRGPGSPDSAGLSATSARTRPGPDEPAEGPTNVAPASTSRSASRAADDTIRTPPTTPAAREATARLDAIQARPSRPGGISR